MSIFSHLWCGCLSSTYSPNWLVSNDNLGPVSDRLLEGIELTLAYLIGSSILSFFKHFSNAYHSVKSTCLSFGNFLGDNLICFSIQRSSLRMTNNTPIKIKIFSLWGSDLSSECSSVCCTYILTGDLDFWINHSFNCSNVHSDWRDNDIKSGFIELCLVKSIIDECVDWCKWSIGFPVASDNEFSSWFHVWI